MTGGQRNDEGLLSQIHIAMIRLDSKLDGLIVQMNNIGETQRDHEIRIRAQEMRPHVDPVRVTKLEERAYVDPGRVSRLEENHVSPAGLKWAVGITLTIMGILATVIIAIVKT
jgi:hypothetical protein